ncbi:ral-GDS-related protein isoform X2 [Rhinolophus sinicus]|uniref:ral-GDS-related protein isoform X2 n=1 Tax=Rhinolophus sinicus TaxID=89399 RepID=UPI003D79C303
MDIKKKENKVMEELVLLEEAAQKYKLEPGEQFGAWFWDMERLSEHESYILSCQLEPGPRWPAEHARPGTSGTSECPGQCDLITTSGDTAGPQGHWASSFCSS